MEDIKDRVKQALDMSETNDHGFKATLAGVAVGFIAKRFTHDTAIALGVGLLAYAAAKRV